MSEQRETTTDHADDSEQAEPVEQPETDHNVGDSATEQSSGDGSNAEAARYRHRAKAAEAERDELRGQVEALQRAEVDRIAEAASIRPAALWASGADLDGLVGDDGTVDTDKVTAAIEHARDELGLAKPLHLGNHVPREGHQPETTSSGPSMVDIVQGRDE